MPLIKVTPAEGVTVRNPDLGYAPLPAAGDTVQDSAYWRQHAADGAVSIEKIATSPRVIQSVPPQSRFR